MAILSSEEKVIIKKCLKCGADTYMENGLYKCTAYNCDWEYPNDWIK